MARASSHSDVFTAVAEPQRRAILAFLVSDERSVGDVVDAIGINQPSVSKHLRVLRDVDLVRARRDGRHVLYRTNAAAVRPIHAWAATFERYWQDQLRRIRDRAEAAAADASTRPPATSRPVRKASRARRSTPPSSKEKPS